MESVYKTSGTNQAIYIMELLVQNILELGPPYNRMLLANMPIKLVSICFLILTRSLYVHYSTTK